MQLPDTSARLRRPAGPGRSHYLLEDYYLWRTAERQLLAWLRATIRILSKWATSYEVRDISGGSDEPRRALPDDPSAREHAITEALDSLHLERSALLRIGINLYVDDATILNQFDGFPGILTLRPDQFKDLQSAWQAHHVPVDFYYPADQQRTLAEAVPIHGGLVRRLVGYSPRMWRRRNQDRFVPPSIPSEESRREQLAAACAAFSQALLLRMQQLNEPGRKVDPEEFAELSAALRGVSTIEARLAASAKTLRTS